MGEDRRARLMILMASFEKPGLAFGFAATARIRVMVHMYFASFSPSPVIVSDPCTVWAIDMYFASCAPLTS